MWKSYFKEHILERGLIYYHNGFVSNLSVGKELIKANVSGSQIYKVEISKDEDYVNAMICNCPYANKGNHCKHMAAVLYAWDNSFYEADNSVKALVLNADINIVESFLIEVLENDEKLLNRFISTINVNFGTKEIRKYKSQIDNIFTEYSDRSGFIDYRKSTYLGLDLEEILENDIQIMLTNSLFEESFELTKYIFIKLDKQHMDDSAGYTALLADEISAIWHDILNICKIELKRKMFNWFFANINGSVIDYLEEYLLVMIFDNFNEMEFLDKKILYLEKEIDRYEKEDDSNSVSYNLNRLKLRYIKTLELKGLEQEDIKAFCQNNLKFNSIREFYIDYCIKNEEFDTAIKLLEEGKENSKSIWGLQYQYSLKLKELYFEIKNYEAYEKELWKLVINYHPGDRELYKELKSLYTEEQWLVKREIVFDKLSTNYRIASLYEIEKLYERLVGEVVKRSGLTLLYHYEPLLRELFPEKLLKKYQEEVEEMALESSNRKTYRAIVSNLRRMKEYPDSMQIVDNIKRTFQEKYKNRPAMMDELNKL